MLLGLAHVRATTARADGSLRCGCASLVVFMRARPYLQMVALAGVMVIIIGGAARNAGCPAAAAGQIVAGLLPMFVACGWMHDRDHLAFCVVIAFEAFAAFSMMLRLNARLVRLLHLNDENLALVAEIRRANADLSAAATTDSLTGIANRRRFHAVLRGAAAHERSRGALRRRRVRRRLERTHVSDAAAVAEAVRARIEAFAIAHVASRSGIVTVSIGVAA